MLAGCVQNRSLTNEKADSPGEHKDTHRILHRVTNYIHVNTQALTDAMAHKDPVTVNLHLDTDTHTDTHRHTYSTAHLLTAGASPFSRDGV